MPSCAFLTLENRSGWFLDDALAIPPLRSLGWEVEEVVWNHNVDWGSFDVVVVRSPWDYQRHLPDFFATLARIEASDVRLLNPLNVIRWNVDKRYLFDLQSRGIEIVPTIALDSPNAKAIRHCFIELGGTQFVSKPTIGATADDTFKLDVEMSDAELNSVCEAYRDKTCLVQPFMPSITREGEYSLLYFNGLLSHVILKTVQAGDFRVQEEHGGGVERVPTPGDELVLAGMRVMATLTDAPLYARVDLVRTSVDNFALMELELIEPCLYFRFDPQSPLAFAKAIIARHAQDNRLLPTGSQYPLVPLC